MKSALLIVALASSVAHAEPGGPLPPSWLSTEVVIGDVTAGHESWACFGFGLAVSHVLIGHLELGGEAEALNLDATAMDDQRHGFGLRSGASIGYRFVLSRWAGFEWAIGPELGVATSVAFDLGIRDRTTDEVFGGIRGSARVAVHRSGGNSRGFGATVGARIARSDGELTSTVVFGYDWGL